MLPALTALPHPSWTTRARSLDLDLRKRAPELGAARVAPWREHPLLVLDKGEPWLVSPYDRDPLTQKDGGYPFPRDVRTVLARLVERGVEFDDLAVAHELDPSGPVHDLVGKIPPQGLRCDVVAAAALVGPLPATKGTQRVGAALDTSGKALATGAAVAPLVLAAAAVAPLVLLGPVALAAELDPIIFGVRHLDNKAGTSGPSLWYPLAAWKW